MTDPETPPVGFMSPPKYTRFQKGLSGNPRGRPRKRKDINTILQQVLDRKVRIRDDKRQMPIRDALIWKLRDLALQGDKQALALHRKILDQSGLAQKEVHAPGDVKKRILKAFENMGVKVVQDSEHG